MHCGLAQGVAVDVVDRPAKGLGVEQGVLEAVRVILEALVGSEASAGGPTELAAHRVLLAGDVLDRLPYEVVMVRVAFDGGRGREALGCAEYFELALGHALSSAVHPC